MLNESLSKCLLFISVQAFFYCYIQILIIWRFILFVVRLLLLLRSLSKNIVSLKNNIHIYFIIPKYLTLKNSNIIIKFISKKNIKIRYLYYPYLQFQKFKKMSIKTPNYSILVLLVVLAVLSPTNSDDIQVFLGTGQQVKIKAQQKLFLNVVIDRDVSQKQNLYITAESPFNDPFQEPIVYVTSDNQFKKACFQQQNDFLDICSIPSKQLKKDRKFKIQLYCQVDCKLYVSVYLSELYSVDIGQSITIVNKEKTAIANNLLYQIPKDAQFTQFYILSTPKDISQIVEGTLIFANYGTSPETPTPQKYMVKAQSTSSHRLGIFLSKTEINPGDKISVLVLIAPNEQIEVRSSLSNKNIYELYLGEPIYDFITDGNNRTYIIDISEYLAQNQTFDDTLKIKFISYSGEPQIQVSFDQSFKKDSLVQSWFGDTSYSFEITPQIRKEKGFVDKVYIRISGFWSSNFYIGAFINKKPFSTLQTHITELVHLEKSSIKNLIFIDTTYASKISQDGLVQYKIQLKHLKNKAKFYVRQSGSKNKTNVMQYIIKQASDLQKKQISQQFNVIQYKVDEVFDDTTFFIFSYNITSSCLLLDAEDLLKKRYTCRFHILLHNQNTEEQSYVGIMVMKDTISGFLTEGIVEKGSVMKNDFNYYAFYLPSINNITTIQFYVTVLQGDVSILVSNQIVYPTLADLTNSKNDLKFSIYNTISISGSQIKAGFYYIGIYGYSMTDYHIGVAIQRKKVKTQGNNTQTSQQASYIRLKKGQTQTYTMPANKMKSNFIFSPKENKEKAFIRIVEIKGHVIFRIYDQTDNNKLVCESLDLLDNGDDTCEFDTVYNHDYIVTVIGTMQSIQTFTILYSSQLYCNFYFWNLPLFIDLQKQQKQCYVYTMKQLQNIHISLGISTIEALTKQFSIVLKFANGEVNITDHQKKIQKSQLQLLCKSNKTNSYQACKFNVTMQNTQKQPVSFYIAVQNYQGQNVLIDRVVYRFQTTEISKQKSKNFFYYDIKSQNVQDLSVLLMSQTNSKYRLKAKIITQDQFIRDINQSLYPKFQEKGQNVFEIDSSYLSTITLLSVKKQKLRSFFGDNNMVIVLISVFGYPSLMQDLQYIFKIQISKGGTELMIGQSKMGYVDQDSVFQYEIALNGKPSVLQIQQYDSACVKAQIINPSAEYASSEISNIYAFKNQTGPRIVVLRTNQKYCTYQIKFSQLDAPVISIFPSMSHRLSLKSKSTKYYVYYHNSPDTFSIIQMVSAGSSYLYALGHKDIDINQWMKKDLDKFDYSSEINGNLKIRNQSEKFCYKCYYLIAVNANQDANIQLTISISNIPTYLKNNALLRERLDQKQFNRYQVYSRTPFTISAIPIYGKITMAVVFNNTTLVQERVITPSQTTLINITQSSNNSTGFDWYQQTNKYFITIKAQQKSSYFIQIKKTQQSVKLIALQNVPVNINLNKQQQAILTFQNIHDNHELDVLIQDLSYSQNNQTSYIEVTAELGQDKNMIVDTTKSQGIYNIKLKPVKGNYTLKIKSNMQTSLTVIFAKNQFVHLMAGRTYLMNRPAFFEIYSPGSSIFVEVFSCEGDLDLRASMDYELLQQSDDDVDGVIRMEHANYGGHYVVTANKLYGEYFLQTIPDEETKNISYLITYHLFTPQKGQRMPYHIYTVKNLQITYKYTGEGVQFSLNRVQKKDGSQMDKGQVTYKFYISSNERDVERMKRCSLGKVFTSVQTKDAQRHGYIVFNFTASKIKQIIGSQQNYVIGAQAVLKLDEKSYTNIKEVSFIYESSRLNVNNQAKFNQIRKQEQTAMTIWLWVVLPLVVSGLFLLFAARYLIRSFSAYPTQLVEEDVAQSHNAIEETKPAQPNHQNM